jgi:hypothetical protein
MKVLLKEVVQHIGVKSTAEKNHQGCLGAEIQKQQSCTNLNESSGFPSFTPLVLYQRATSTHAKDQHRLAARTDARNGNKIGK